MSVKRGRELELDFIRVISMFMIIFCHISAEAGMKWGEYFNVGVMIFMFMSGYLPILSSPKSLKFKAFDRFFTSENRAR